MQIFTKRNHVNEGALGLHALNDLPESRRELVEEHLSSCSQCRSQFDEVQEFITVFRMAARRSSQLASAS
jgi:predicted anti-sigma-YlaC factor YlaD